MPATQPTAPLDLFSIDTLLEDDERAIRDTVRRFCDDRIRPHVADWYESASLPARDLAKELGALGLMGMHLDGYGCAGTTATAYGLACLELEAADSGIRSLVSVQGSLAMFAIHRYGSDDQKEHWLPQMSAGTAIGCFGLTEPDFGSDPGGMRTRASRDGSDWVINGTKMWITNGAIADVAVVWARTDDPSLRQSSGQALRQVSGQAAGAGQPVIRGFVVPTDTPGFSAPEIKHKMSLRASVTSELVLEDVRLPDSAVLPEAHGLGGPLSCLSEARFGIVFGALGAARECLETTIEYARSRRVFEKSLASYQLTQEKLANMTLELGKGMLLALHLGRLKDSTGVRNEQVSLGKLNNVREALAIARECRTILAANGITLEYPVMRHANNLESVLTYEGTSEVHQLVIGQALTGESAFR